MGHFVRLAVTNAEAARLSALFDVPMVKDGYVAGTLVPPFTMEDVLSERRYPSNILPRKAMHDWIDAYLDHSQRITCLLDRSHIVKFGCPQNAFTGGQNRREALLWSYVRDTPLRGFFTGIIGAKANGEWIVAERADLSPLDITEDFLRLKRIIRAEIDVDDIRPENTGYHNLTGKLVCRDFGYTPEIAQNYYSGKQRGTCGVCMWCQLRAYLDKALVPQTTIGVTAMI